MSQTPRTDAAISIHYGDGEDYVSADFARKLEKELSKARQSHILAQMERHMKEAHTAWMDKIKEVERLHKQKARTLLA